jgi:hypothetical protein
MAKPIIPCFFEVNCCRYELKLVVAFCVHLALALSLYIDIAVQGALPSLSLLSLGANGMHFVW